MIFKPGQTIQYTGSQAEIKNEIGKIAKQLEDGRYCVWFFNGTKPYAVTEKSMGLIETTDGATSKGPLKRR